MGCVIGTPSVVNIGHSGRYIGAMAVGGGLPPPKSTYQSWSKSVNIDLKNEKQVPKTLFKIFKSRDKFIFI